MTLIEFNHKFLTLASSLESFAFSLTYDKKKAQALLHATFLKALKYRNRFVQGHNFKVWMYTTMQQLYISNNYSIEEQPQAWDLDHFLASGFDDYDLGYAAKVLGQHMEHLKEDFLIIFKMHLQGLKYNEIADELNINPETVRSRIFFSRKALMDGLKE
jgi:RNA polymerase sigma-70 factor, ECF subfamily